MLAGMTTLTIADVRNQYIRTGPGTAGWILLGGPGSMTIGAFHRQMFGVRESGLLEPDPGNAHRRDDPWAGVGIRLDRDRVADRTSPAQEQGFRYLAGFLA